MFVQRPLNPDIAGEIISVSKIHRIYIGLHGIEGRYLEGDPKYLR